MNKYQNFLKEYKKEMIAFCIFIIGIFAFSISYTFAAVEPVRSIVIESENTNFASGEEGSWQVTKSGYWTNYGEAEVTLDVDTNLMTNNEYTDIIFVLDISGSMAGEKLDRVKSDSKELISSLLSNKNNQAALITFDTESQIVSELTNDEELLTNEIDNLQVGGVTNYYQALVNVDSILQDYQKESGREMVVLFLTDGYPNVDTPNQIGEYQYLKSTYPYITINGVQYEMGDSILNPIREISDNQFIADTETLNNVLFDASVAPVTYDAYQIVDYIDNENFTLENKDDIKVTTGKVELAEENGRQKITWNLDNLASGREANLTMKLKLKDEFVGQGGIYPTNESTEVISKIESHEEDVTTTNTPILADNYKVIYDGNAPEGCSVTNIPETYNYSVFSTIEISDQVPSCEGYEFKGWSIATDGITRVSEDYFIMPGEDVVIKAEWSKIGITKSMNGTVNTMGDPIMKRYYSSTNTDYHSSTYKSKITSIVTKDNMEIPSTAIESWDVSEAGDGSVIAYVEDDGRGTGTYKVTIGAQGNIIASSGYDLFGGNSSSNSFSSLETIDLTYLDTSRVTNMESMFEHCDSLINITLGDDWDTSQVTNMSDMFGSCSSLASLDLSNFDTSSVTDMSFMFSYCSNLTNLNLSSFDTSQVTNMSWMFANCDLLTNLDMSNFDTNQVKNMREMFSDCSSLTNINFGNNCDMRQVTNMISMFENCSSLTSLDLSSINTSQVTNMSGMFDGCSSLTDINFGNNFDTGQVTNMSGMFASCSSLTDINFGDNFDTGQVTDMSLMFRGCSSLTNLNLSNFDTSQVTDMSQMFYSCEILTNLDLNSFKSSQVTDMSSMFASCYSLKSLDVSNFDTSQVTDMHSMFYECSSLTSLDLSSFKTSQVTDMSGMFIYCESLSVLDVSDFDTSQVTDMSDMFYACSSLTNLDLSSFDTSKVIYMGNMFGECISISELNLSTFNTANVVYITDIFYGCSGLTSITFGPGWTNDKITDMSGMFSDLTKLTTINFNGFKTPNVTDMNSMFNNCESLTTLDLSSFDTSQVTDMHYMFGNCGNLASLDLSHFDTSNVVNMEGMFHSMMSLYNLNLSGWDTSNVTNMGQMFTGDGMLMSLDLSSFDTSKVTDMNHMFDSCSILEELKLNLDTFDTSNVVNMECMFQYCYSIKTEIVLRTDSLVYYSDMFTFAADDGYSSPYIYVYSDESNADFVDGLVSDVNNSNISYMGVYDKNGY